MDLEKAYDVMIDMECVYLSKSIYLCVYHILRHNLRMCLFIRRELVDSSEEF